VVSTGADCLLRRFHETGWAPRSRIDSGLDLGARPRAYGRRPRV